jgi:hypothetical protein
MAYSYWVLVVLLLSYILNQWDRYLIAYLSGTTVPQCSTDCKGVGVEYCDSCPNLDHGCKECHACLRAHDIQYYNIGVSSCCVRYSLSSAAGDPSSGYCSADTFVP